MLAKIKDFAKRRKNLSLLFLLFLILLTVYSLSLELNRIEDSSAATARVVEFKKEQPRKLSATQTKVLNEYKNPKSIMSTTILKINNINKVASASKIVLPIQNTNLELTKKSSSKPYKKVNIWMSETEYRGNKYNSYFATNKGTLVGLIDLGNKKYELMSIDAKNVLMREVDTSKLQRHPKDFIPKINSLDQNASKQTNRKQTNTPTEVNILGVYTPEFEGTFGSVSNAGWQMESFMALQVETVNSVLYNSMVFDTKVRLVGIMKHSLPTEIIPAIDDIGVSSSYDEIYKMRSSSGADVVAVFHNEDSNFCGIVKAIAATYSTSYMIVNRYGGCLTFNTFAHEFGHLAGGGHEDEYNGTVSYAHALVSDTGKFFTTMSAAIYYGPDYIEIPFFSTPLIIYTPANSYIGTEDYYNNRKKIKSHLPFMAGFTTNITPTTGPSITAAPSSTGTCGNKCNTVSDCDPNGNYQCKDVNSGDGKVCWNDSLCMISPQRNRRISGKVLDCSGNPKVGVKVNSYGYDFNKTSTTDANGVFTITEGNNKCSVDKDSGQTFYLLTGKDADSTHTDYYGRVDNPVFSESGINCTNVNCGYTGNQAAGGPTRQSYHLSVDTFKNNPNVYNAYVCQENGKFLSGFDFKQVNCPVQSTTYTEQYMARGGKLWHQNNKNGWSGFSDVTGNLTSVGSGVITSFSTHQNANGTIEQYLTRGGEIWHRNNLGSSFSNVTNNVKTVGSGTITSFTASVDTGGKVHQYMTRGGVLWHQNNVSGWSGFSNVTSNISSVGSGTITSFSSTLTPEGYYQQYLTRGGVLWARDNQNGWGTSWTNVTSNVSSVGSGTIQTFYSSRFKK